MNWDNFEIVFKLLFIPGMLLWVGALIHDLIQVLLRRRA